MSKGIFIMAAAIAVAAATYYGLEWMFPPQAAVSTSTDNSVTTERVFGASGLIETAAPAEAAALPVSEADLATAEIGMDTELAAEDPVPTSEAAADETLAADESMIAAETIAPEPETAPQAEPAAAEPAQAAAAPAPASQAKPKAPAAAAPASKSPAPAPTWWGQSAPGELGLVYAGSAAYARAIVLMFDGDFANPSAAGKQIRVSNAAGKTVSGSWSVNDKNPRMLTFKVDSPGTYRVSLNAALTDKAGRKLGRNQQGPVTVQ